MQFCSIFNPKFPNFSSKNANLDNFIPKKCNFGQLSPYESEKYGVIITFFETFPNGVGEASDGFGWPFLFYFSSLTCPKDVLHLLVKNLQTFNTNSLLHVLKVNDIVLINESIQNLPVELVVPLLNAIHEALQISKFKLSL